MFYEEKMINGILMFRSSTDGDWRQVDIQELSRRAYEAKLGGEMPAFSSGVRVGNVERTFGGLTKLEYFSSSILQGMLSNPTNKFPNEMVSRAVNTANLLIEELEKCQKSKH